MINKWIVFEGKTPGNANNQKYTRMINVHYLIESVTYEDEKGTDVLQKNRGPSGGWTNIPCPPEVIINFLNDPNTIILDLRKKETAL